MIKIVNLKKSFNSHEVLKGVNLVIPGDKITFIMGRSGTGKSVLLKHIVGLLKPDEGEIWFENQDITKLSERQLQAIRKKIGFLFQEGALFDSMTVAENVAFPLKEHTNLSKKEIEKKVEELLSAVELFEAQDKYPSALSGGMRKRAALARTLALNPQVILFDEPTTGLDPILQITIMDLIKKIKETFHLTCVIISHDLLLAYKYADYIAFLDQGFIIEEGDVEKIKASTHPFVVKFRESALLELEKKEV
ncbi:MAG: ABC transporter ATP-binding protein [Caldimicrobium thiodismutans]|jgi:phospholipid/cholesterol/gamma-HCH transport system ATP-binding protein|uniref:ABC transporter ATP-binding protein n=1 Tax=Caldimicrobium thiodismutans TaxID=1653476 RepID=A0A2N7PKC4_9BACT|nr:MAG: ABC transporter ATP-binding protein [Caldimicrobium thiodismutans]